MAAADIWEKINKGELQSWRRKSEKKLSKPLNAPKQEALRDPAEFDNDVLQDIDLGSSTKEWAKASVSAAYVTKRPSKQESFDSTIAAVDANTVNTERLVSYVKRKQSADTGTANPIQPLDRAADTRRKMLEAREQIAEKEKWEEEERQTEKRRQEEEQEQRAVEHQRLAEEEQRQRDEGRARALAQMTKTEDRDRYDTNDSQSRRPSTSRRSNTSSKSKRERKSREKPLTRANTFADHATTTGHDSATDKKPSSRGSSAARSMSMSDQKRPDFNTTMPSIAEGGRTDGSDERGVNNSRTREAANPFSDRMARRSDGSTRTPASLGYSSKYNHGTPISRDAAENPFTSVEDPKVSFASTQRSSGASSTESRHQAQRRSNASSNDSRPSSDSRRSLSYPKRDNSKSSAQSRSSGDSKSGSQLAADREKPERKSSFTTRALSKLSRKSSSDENKDRESASSTQSWERDGPDLRGGREVFVEEPKEMSASEDEHGDGHGDWGKQEDKENDEVKMRGGAGEKTVESGNESGVETNNDEETDAGEIEHSEHEFLEDEHSESDNHTEEHDSSADEVSDDDTSEDEHSKSEGSDVEQSDADSLDDGSEDEELDDEREQTLL